MTRLTAIDVTVRLDGKTILDGVNAEFHAGKVSVILGPNGAGKSTLLGVLSGLRQGNCGTACIDDVPLAGMSRADIARQIGFLPQKPELHWDLRVYDLVALGRLPRQGRFGRLSQADEAAVARALYATDTTQFADRDAGSLSGGELSRVLLARALAGEPSWIIADEPLSHLDPAHQRDMLTTLQAVAQGGQGVLLVLHDLTLAHRIADRIVLLDRGALVASGGREVLEDTALVERVYGIAFERIERPGQPSLIVPVP